MDKPRCLMCIQLGIGLPTKECMKPRTHRGWHECLSPQIPGQMEVKIMWRTKPKVKNG